MKEKQPTRLRRLAESMAEMAACSGAVSITMGAVGGERVRLDVRPGRRAYWARLYRGRPTRPLGKCVGRGWHPAGAVPLLPALPLHLKVVASGRRRRFHYPPGQVLPLLQLSVYHAQ